MVEWSGLVYYPTDWIIHAVIGEAKKAIAIFTSRATEMRKNCDKT
jgi:hypothetical protein